MNTACTASSTTKGTSTCLFQLGWKIKVHLSALACTGSSPQLSLGVFPCAQAFREAVSIYVDPVMRIPKVGRAAFVSCVVIMRMIISCGFKSLGK